jgi:hypothetical protein
MSIGNMIEEKIDKYLGEMAVMKPAGTKYTALYKLIGYKDANEQICEFCSHSAVYGQSASGRELKECMNEANKEILYNFLEKQGKDPYVDLYVNPWGTCKRWKRDRWL